MPLTFGVQDRGVQSRRDCINQPRVARNELPWGHEITIPSTLKGLQRALLAFLDSVIGACLSLLKCPPSAIPKGWNHSAQGCEERATLGVLVTQSSTLQGLYQLLSMNTHAPNMVEERQDERAATLLGLVGLLFVSRRVARSSQPWAERYNPFGIER